MSKITTHNEKGFLLPDSIQSMAAYHMKIKPDGIAVFRIHDCNGGIRLWNDLTKPEEVHEMCEKLRTLGAAAIRFAHVIDEMYNI
jgi:hypothetical protein